MKKEKATIKTIAKEANCAINTVSLALRDSDLVKGETKKRIQSIAEKQGYIPNILSKALRTGHNKLIALVFPGIVNPFFAIKMKLISEELHKYDYQVMILDTADSAKAEQKAIHTAISHKVDGIIIDPKYDRSSLDTLNKYNVPCVLIGNSFEDNLEDTVVWDNFNGAYLATKNLISRGYRKILFLRFKDSSYSLQERIRGYEHALKEAGIPVKSELILTTELGHIKKDLMRILVEYDSVFTFNDLLGWEAACYISDNIPIIGFDNIQEYLSIPFSMSSVATNLNNEVETVVDLLLNRIKNPTSPTQKIILPTKLVLR